jgi:hypothetical protein
MNEELSAEVKEWMAQQIADFSQRDAHLAKVFKEQVDAMKVALHSMGDVVNGHNLALAHMASRLHKLEQ